MKKIAVLRPLILILAVTGLLGMENRANAQLFTTDNPGFPWNPTVYSVAADGTKTVTASYGPTTSATIGAIAKSSDGTLYVAVTGSSGAEIDKVTSSGFSTFIAAGTGGLQGVSAMTFDANGNLVVSSTSFFEGGSGSVLQYTSAGTFDKTVYTPSVAEGLAGLAIDAAGNIFVANSPGFDPGAVGTITEIATDGTVSTFVSDLGQTQFQQAIGATALAFNQSGTLYATTSNDTLVSFDADGNQTVIATLTQSGPLAIDPEGNYYVAGSTYIPHVGSESYVEKISPDGLTSTIVATGFQNTVGIVYNGGAVAAPEPSSYAFGLIVLGVLGAAIYRRRMA